MTRTVIGCQVPFTLSSEKGNVNSQWFVILFYPAVDLNVFQGKLIQYGSYENCTSVVR